MIVSAHNGYPRWLDSGADYVEVDIRRTRQGTIVLAHDQLRWWRRYASLEDVLEAASGRIGVQLDLKEPGYELEVVRRVVARCQVVVTSQLEASLRLIKGEFPDVRVGLTRPHAEETHADFLCLDHARLVDGDLNFGKPVWLWTVDDPATIGRYAADSRIEGLITNRPDLALELRTARS